MLAGVAADRGCGVTEFDDASSDALMAMLCKKPWFYDPIVLQKQCGLGHPPRRHTAKAAAVV